MVYGGLEVLLCDSHLLYNSNIAGIRFVKLVYYLLYMYVGVKCFSFNLLSHCLRLAFYRCWT